MSRRIRLLRQRAKAPVISVQIHGEMSPEVIYDVGRRVRAVLAGRQVIVTDDSVTVRGAS